ncbi:MAG: transporter [Verrucomicrobiales bacterium]|nr:transporter [Verrucomicrobiales bacterium]
MKSHFFKSFLTAVCAVPFALSAGDYYSDSGKETSAKNYSFAEDYDSHRVDAHAPIGVMGDHTHEAGEWMVSYRYMNMNMDGHRNGTQSLTNHQVFHFGYSTAAQEMEMDMQMVGLMYAPSDWLTLTAMFNYVRMDMEMMSNPHAAHGGHGHGGHAAAPGSTFSHSSEGLGDITVGGLVKIYDRNRQRVHLNFGFVLPTAEVDHMEHGSFLPYGMQSGEGTFAFKPGITYLGQSDRFSWGAQATGLIHLEEENESGFRYGDGINLTSWVAYPLSDSLSISGRLNYSYQDQIEGHYNGPHGHSAPPHLQQNYGGDALEAGIGLNLLLGGGHRLAVEALFPVEQDAHGVGMERDYSIVAGWQKAF